MTTLLPAALYGLKVSCDGMPAQATEIPGTFRITMAAIDPSAKPIIRDSHGDAPPRATLKLIKIPSDVDDDDDDYEDIDSDDDDVDAIERRLGMGSGSESDEDEDEEKNGGPSDPAKAKKAREQAQLKELLNGVDKAEDVDMENGENAILSIVKGKGKASDDDEDESESESELEEDAQEFVICTLDPEKHYQQPIDITIGADEAVFFQVNGTHDIYITGNYVIPHDHEGDDEDEDEDYGLAPFEDGLEESDEESEEDELDDMEDPRITEVDSDEEEIPKLIKAASKAKNKNKRAAESDEEGDLDDMIKKDILSIKAEPTANGEQKLSKKQLKKMKNNAGQAVAPAAQDKPMKKEEISSSKDSSTNGKPDKKVQFAKNLEQGPTSSPKSSEVKKDAKSDQTKSGVGVTVVQGVKIDVKKAGEGRAAKKGNKIGMRYIGKLEKDNKVFDSNKKGKPFTFKLGTGEVIKGWDIGIEGIKVGGERRITVPANLGYGKQSTPGIPANSNLVFDVKCISID